MDSDFYDLNEFHSFGTRFNIVFILFIAIFILFIIIFIISLGRQISIWNKNNHSPRLTVKAKVTSKRLKVSRHHRNTATEGFHTSSSTTYYVTFEVESGDRMELRINDSEYGILAEGDTGNLSFQGTRYLGFDRCL